MDDKAEPLEPSDSPFISSIYHIYKDDCLFLYIVQEFGSLSKELPTVYIYQIRGEHPWDTFFGEIRNLPYPPDTHNSTLIQTSEGSFRVVQTVL